MARRAWDADAGTVRTWDGVVVFWVVFWLVIGAWTGYLLWQLTGLAASTVDSGRSLGSAASALRTLSAVPIIGDQTGALGEQVGATADGIVRSGRQADSSIRGLSVLLGAAVALAPSGAVLLFYLPARVARRREVKHVRRGLDEHGDTAAMRALLAHRAVATLDPSRLMSITSDPHADLAEGRHGDLAAAELHRLGI
ncbi:hypothetical protein [Phycicoccus flavus]|uniref:hypothetical protein n=1 Tax=Phycicoccus flavus TaxID=2502783 RepID=UPI000FEC10F4|nr:hypothetical protein [Phycicoccus flavus]NHA69627.1 hypothetical protein [Phycicoccus flavus]